MARRRHAVQLLCTAAVALCAAQTNATDKPYQFGVFPNLPHGKIYDIHAPMAHDFEAKLGRQVRFSTQPDYASFSKALRKETYDIALVQPFDYVEAHDKHEYLPLARRGEALEAVIVVKYDSPLSAMQELKDRIVANPPPDAAVSQLTSMAFREAGIDPQTGVKRYYGKNHFACLQSVVIGAADACGTSEQALRTIDKEKYADRFRILHKTGSIPHSLFVAHSRVPQKDREIVLRTILDWPNTETGRQILERGQFKPFVAAKDSEYEVVRRYIRNRD